MAITLNQITDLQYTQMEQGALLSATLRLVERGHILAEQRQVSARWSRGHE